MKIKVTKGFTLTELLIVMAIIVVLAAVAIPTFGKQLETSRETGDMEIIRNAYTEALSIAILDAADGKINGLLNDGTTASDNNTTGWDGITFVKDATNGDYYVVDLPTVLGAKFSQRKDENSTTSSDTNANRKAAWKYVDSKFMDRRVPIVDTDKTKLQFRFIIVTDDDVKAATTGTNTTPAGPLYGQGLVAGDVVLKADTEASNKFAINAEE